MTAAEARRRTDATVPASIDAILEQIKRRCDEGHSSHYHGDALSPKQTQALKDLGYSVKVSYGDGYYVGTTTAITW